MVSDGQQVKVYEAGNKQMYEQAVEQASQYPAALSFLTGQGKLADASTSSSSPARDEASPAGTSSSGTPKQATPAYSKVLFYVDRGTSQVRRVMIIDGQGNRNRFDFTAPRINDTVPDESVQVHASAWDVNHPAVETCALAQSVRARGPRYGLLAQGRGRDRALACAACGASTRGARVAVSASRGARAHALLE